MDDEIKKYLLDIKTSINYINSYIEGKRVFAEFEQNRLLRMAIERELEIIGEAVSRIKVRDANLPITGAEKIKGTRNIIAHEYDRVDYRTIWSIVINHLPTLLSEVEKHLSA
jgi:uncharacterized protein with HEPN domain